MQRILDLKTEPVIGQSYLVPCVFHDLTWIPVMGGLHEDQDLIGFPHYHLHYDFRFLSEELFLTCEYGSDPGLPPNIGRIWNSVIVLKEYEYECATYVNLVEQPLECQRKMPQFDHNIGQDPQVHEPGGILPGQRLESAYAEVQVIVRNGCRICPHRGLPLDGLPVDCDGVVTCPGHGLRWKKDGRMALRCGELVT